MTPDQPSNAPDGTPPEPRDADTAAAVLRDDQGDPGPGGGGLMRSGGDAPRGGGDAAAPNSPIDAALPHDGGDRAAETEAQVRSASDDAAA